MTSNPLLAGGERLRPGDAVAALILVESDGYLMQLRDPRTDIWYPGHWGLFGGGVEAGEEPRDALARELKEELELEQEDAEFFARFDFDLAGLRLPRYFRSYYLVPITRAVQRRLVLHEGAEMRVFSGEQILQESRVTPYDSFALFLHYARVRVAAPG
ncbi:MAG: NUDIX domain-containing protein [Stellaceae bacterium]